MTVVKLPDAPRETEFEEFISAFVQCSGRFVERNIRERSPNDICELDIVATDHTDTDSKAIIIEVKSGKCGFNDIFTLKGKAIFLGVADVLLVSLEDAIDRDLKEYVATKVGISVAYVGDHEQAKDALRAFLGDVECLKADTSIWRYAYWIERTLLKQLSKLRKDDPLRKGPRIVWDYFQQLQTNMFQLDMLVRTEKIYSNFSSNPYLTARWANELEGRDWDEEHKRVPTNIFNSAYYTGGIHELNIVTHIEHKTRLCILKNLVDYSLYRTTSPEDLINKNICKVMGMDIRFLDQFPSSFKTALDQISKQPYFHKYAILWQWFINVFGCFILLDYEKEDYTELSRVSGIPVEYVPQALTAFDTLFPTEGTWFRDHQPRSRIRVLKLAPVPLLGVGANYRRFLYSKNHTFESLSLTGGYTRCDLQLWNKCLVEYLAPS